MARHGLVRVPYYPQLSVLTKLHPCAPQVMSLLLFWHTRAGTPEAYTYCPKRHDFQLAQQLGLSLTEFQGAYERLCQEHVLGARTFELLPKEATPGSKIKSETRYNLNLGALKDLLTKLGAPTPAQNLKLLAHAAADSFECYDVIEEKFLPLTQSLIGVIAGAEYEAAALLCARFMVYLNEEHEELAQRAIAPGWKLLLNVPLGQAPEDYAQDLVQRYLRPGERAVDLSFSDGNFFLPDHDHIKTTIHTVKHYQGRKDHGALTITAALMLLLCAHFPKNFSYSSELAIAELKDALELLAAFDHNAVAKLKLDPRESASEHRLLTQLQADLSSH